MSAYLRNQSVFEIRTDDVRDYGEPSAESVRKVMRAVKITRDNRVSATCKVVHPTLVIGRHTAIRCETPMPHGEGEHWNSYAMRTW